MSKIHIFFFMKDIRRIFVRIIKIKYICKSKQLIMKYPIGIQDFKKIRKDGFVYIDKTALLYKLVNNTLLILT